VSESIINSCKKEAAKQEKVYQKWLSEQQKNGDSKHPDEEEKA
jgi:hypothetical protein